MLTDPISIRALADRARRLLFAAFAPWTIMPPDEWAEKVRKMPGKFGPKPFSFDYAPYQREMFACLFDPRVQETVFQVFSRGGKSEVVLNALGYWIHEQPSSIFVMWPTLGHAKKWSKDNLQRELIDPTPELSALIGDDSGRRKSDNTLLHKIFAGGLIDMVGANSPGDIRRAKGNRLYGDEIDAIMEIASDEGDQLKQFKGRGEEYPDTREVYCSYPSLKGRSRIEAKLLESDYREWWTTCLICGGEPFIMHRSQLRYDREHPELARLECPRCKGHLDDAQRYQMMRNGRWIARTEFRGRAGFHANAMLWPHPVDPLKYPGGFLHRLAQDEIDVEKSDNPERSRRVLINRVDAETYQAACDEKPEHSKLFLRREEYDPRKMLPEGVLWLCFFCDVQKDRIEFGVEGFGVKNQTWGIDYQVIRGSPLCDPDTGVWAELDRYLLSSTFPHPSGKTLRISGGLIDSGFLGTEVFRFTRPRQKRHIYASYGSTQLARPIIGRKPGKRGNPPAIVWEIGTHEAKDIIYQRLERDNPTADGFRHYPKLGQFSEYFFKALVAEDSEMRQAKDGKYYRWFSCDQGVRNEPLDISVGCLAFCKIRKPNFAKLAEELAIKEANTTPDRPKEPEKRRIVIPRRGFVRGWLR